MHSLSDNKLKGPDFPGNLRGQELDRKIKNLLADLSEDVSLIGSSEAGPRYWRDWNDDYGAPAPVARPRTPAALVEVVRRLSKLHIPMVAQGGMSGLAGGGAPEAGEVVVSTELLRQIEDVDVFSGTMTVQSGVTLQAVQEEAERHGLFYPVDLGSRGSCTLGGNIASNAGGNRVLQYGMTRASILGLEVVLPDGTLISRLSQVVKDNAGYDLKHIFIGSEGTLGIVTRAVLRLQPLPRERVTVALGCARLEQVLKALVAARRSFGPALTSFEVMWRDFHSFVTRELGIGRDPFNGDAEFVVILEISCFDSDADRDRARIEDALAHMSEDLGTDQVVIAQSLKDAAEIWRIRDASGEVARMLGEYLSFDISIPTSRLTHVLGVIEAGLQDIDPGLRKVTYGHLGDGNLHLLVACTAEFIEPVERLVYGAIAGIGGSISAEHGIGLSRRTALASALPRAEIEAMRRIKAALDPNNLFSPGRVLDMARALSH